MAIDAELLKQYRIVDKETIYRSVHIDFSGDLSDLIQRLQKEWDAIGLDNCRYEINCNDGFYGEIELIAHRQKTDEELQNEIDARSKEYQESARKQEKSERALFLKLKKKFEPD